MLKRMGEVDTAGAMLPIGEAAFPAPFKSELEYSCSAVAPGTSYIRAFSCPKRMRSSPVQRAVCVAWC